MKGKRGLIRVAYTSAQLIVTSIFTLGPLIGIQGTAHAASSTNYTITGTVNDGLGAPVQNAGVEIFDPYLNEVVDGPVTTAADGTYGLSYSYLPSAPYDIVFTAPAGSGLGTLYEGKISDDTNQTINAQLSPIATPTMSNIQFSDDNHNMYSVNPDGSALSTMDVEGFDPRLSPDGSKILYFRCMSYSGPECNQGAVDPPACDPNNPTPLLDGYDLFVMNSDGSNNTDISAGLGMTPYQSVWSPDGTKIAFANCFQIYVMNADGTGLTEIGRGSSPSWSPDGTKIAYTYFLPQSPGGIGVMNSDGSDPVDIVTGAISDPVWSPDGSKIAFQNRNGNTDEIEIVRPDGSGQTVVSNTSWNLTSTSGIAWSPDSSKLAIIAQPGADAGSGLYVLPLNGGSPTEIVPAAPNNVNGFNNIDYVSWETGPVTNEAAPINLTAPAATNQNPTLTWDNVASATSYNIYRNGTEIGSVNSPTTTYTDTTAPQGSNSYYVTAVNSAGESAPSNTISVVYDTTPPIITYTVSPTPNNYGWNNGPVTVRFTCSDNTNGSGIASCTPPITESTDGTYTVTGYASDNAGNISSTTVAVNIDSSSPMVGAPAWSENPVVTGNNTILTVPTTAAANHSPITGGEYFIGSDPGQGNGTPMTYNTTAGNLTASLGKNLSPGTYQVGVRDQNAAGAWSSVVTSQLVVNPAIAPTITSASSYSIGVRQIITPSDFTITTTGTPNATITETGALPSGLTLTDNGDGTANFTGMIAAGASGTYPLTITATNSAGTVSKSFTLTVTDTDSAPSTIFTSTGSDTLNAPLNTSSSFTFTATGNGKNQKLFVYSGSLPPGLSLHDNKDGTASLSGTPTQSGTYTFTVEAENKVGITYQQFTAVVN